MIFYEILNRSCYRSSIFACGSYFDSSCSLVKLQSNYSPDTNLSLVYPPGFTLPIPDIIE